MSINMCLQRREEPGDKAVRPNSLSIYIGSLMLCHSRTIYVSCTALSIWSFGILDSILCNELIVMGDRYDWIVWYGSGLYALWWNIILSCSPVWFGFELKRIKIHGLQQWIYVMIYWVIMHNFRLSVLDQWDAWGNWMFLLHFIIIGWDQHSRAI